MCWQKALGLFVLASPFIALTIFMYVMDGWKCIFFVWGFVLLTFTILCVGFYLVNYC